MPLTFSESDEEAVKDTQKDNKKKRKAAKILDELLVAEVPKKKRAKDQTIVEKAKTVPDLLTQAGAEELWTVERKASMKQIRKGVQAASQITARSCQILRERQ